MSGECTCARCTGKGRAHPVHGYDLDAVPGHPCLVCGKPIGNEPYREVLTWARYGQMLLVHERCRKARKTSRRRRMPILRAKNTTSKEAQHGND